MKKVFISGMGGNMGTRYAYICSDLGIQVYGMDLKNFHEQVTFCVDNKIDRIIIATPTWNHVDAINIFSKYHPNAFILCEKPIIAGTINNIPSKDKITMVNQYKYLIDPDRFGFTYYNYFKTGKDGLYWDCINIIGLAKGRCVIKNDSPHWRCMINGQRINIRDMDRAYAWMLNDWYFDPKPNIDYIKSSHKKVKQLIQDRGKPQKNKVHAQTEVIPILGKSHD